MRAALAAGFDVRGCEERKRLDDDTRNDVRPAPADIAVGPWEGWPWSLLELAPAAAQAAWDVPAVIVWTFGRRSDAEGD